jgi:hypothetical protein
MSICIEPSEALWSGRAFLCQRKPHLRHGGNRAYYTQALDAIQMPPFEAFRDAESDYATLHRLTHWTEHPQRLCRDLERKSWVMPVTPPKSLSPNWVARSSAPTSIWHRKHRKRTLSCLYGLKANQERNLIKRTWRKWCREGEAGGIAYSGHNLWDRKL